MYVVIDKFLAPKIDGSFFENAFNFSRSRAEKILVDSSLKALESLGINVILGSKNGFFNDGGYWARMGEQERFFTRMAHNFALAEKQDCTLLFLEEDSFNNALYALEIFATKNAYLEAVNEKLKAQNLELDISKIKIEYLPNLLATHLVSAKNLNLKTTILHGGYYGEMGDSKEQQKADLSTGVLLEKTNIQNLKTSTNYFAHLLHTNKNLALSCALNELYSLEDLGADFALALSLSQFVLFDSNRAKMKKFTNRNLSNLPVLFLSEIALLALGKTEQILPHKVKLQLKNFKD